MRLNEIFIRAAGDDTGSHSRKGSGMNDQFVFLIEFFGSIGVIWVVIAFFVRFFQAVKILKDIHALLKDRS